MRKEFILIDCIFLDAGINRASINRIFDHFFDRADVCNFCSDPAAATFILYLVKSRKNH